MRVVKDKNGTPGKSVADMTTESIREEVRRGVAPQIKLLKQQRDELKQLRRQLKEKAGARLEQEQKPTQEPEPAQEHAEVATLKATAKHDAG